MTKDQIFAILQKELSDFLQAEQGNKLTSYAVEGLIHKIMATIPDTPDTKEK